MVRPYRVIDMVFTAETQRLFIVAALDIQYKEFMHRSMSCLHARHSRESGNLVITGVAGFPLSRE